MKLYNTASRKIEDFKPLNPPAVSFYSCGPTVWELAGVYTDYFISSIDALNIIRPDVFSNATQHIPEFIEMIKVLESKGFTYESDELRKTIAEKGYVIEDTNKGYKFSKR